MRVLASGGLRAAVMGLAMAGAALATDLPDAIRKLGGSSDETAAAIMAQNGYVQRNAKTSWTRKLTYWWSDKSHQCVQLTSLAGRVMTVDAKGESHCSPVAAGSTTGAVAVGLIDPLELVGLPSSAAEARLARAGFKVYASYTTVDPNDSRGNVTDIWWSSQRQCFAGHVANDRYEMLQSMPLDQCKR